MDPVDLASLADFPPPPGALVETVASAAGLRIRVARWEPIAKTPRGTVCLMTGRAEFVEKYFEVIGELLGRGFAVVAFDWRGQGMSDRPLANPRRGHVDDFADYAADLDAVVTRILRPLCPGPHFALAHSMGGAILVQALAADPGLFARAVITAPMFEIAGLRRPRVARTLAATLDALGFGAAFIPAGGETAVMTRPFEGNPLTRDARRHARTASLIAAHPQLGLGDPTIGWVHAAFRTMAPLADPNFPLRITTPLLLVAGARDRVTVTAAAERFAARLRAGRALILPDAEHEIMMERDNVRALFWAAFDAFVPGSAARPALSEAGPGGPGAGPGHAEASAGAPLPAVSD